MSRQAGPLGSPVSWVEIVSQEPGEKAGPCGPRHFRVPECWDQGVRTRAWPVQIRVGRGPGRDPPPPAQPRLCPAEHVVALMPEAGSPQHARVLQYRELLDALPMDAYTHGCILHPELTTDSMIPKYATAEIRSECHGLSPFAHLSP